MPTDPPQPAGLPRESSRLAELFSGENRQALTQLDRLAMLGTFSAGLAHEAKNALVAVQTFVDLVLRDQPNAELAGVAQREFARLDSLLTQMLQLAKPVPVQSTAVPIHEVLERALELVRHVASTQHLVLRANLQSAPDIVEGDPHQLQQVFLNLLFNAVEAMRVHGELTLTTEILKPTNTPGLREQQPHREQIRITLRDNGVGIPAENLPRIFEPFFTTKPNGIGLGLAITRRIIEEHRGQIQVSSVLNQGTTFTIDLPLLSPRKPQP